jgi:hypothetical protein
MWGVPSPRTLPDEVWLIKPDGTGELLRVVDYYKLLKQYPQTFGLGFSIAQSSKNDKNY